MNYDLNEHSHELLSLYAILKNAGIQKREAVALMSCLEIEDIWLVLEKIADLMDNNGWLFPTETELLDIIWPIVEERNRIDEIDEEDVD